MILNLSVLLNLQLNKETNIREPVDIESNSKFANVLQSTKSAKSALRIYHIRTAAVNSSCQAGGCKALNSGICVWQQSCQGLPHDSNLKLAPT